MREFPPKFIAGNLAQFNQFKFDRDICYLREAVYEWFIREKPANPASKDELGPFELPYDLQAFVQAREPLMDRFPEMVKIVCTELEKLGWKTAVGHKESSLWVYPKTGTPPKSLPEW